MQYLRMEDIETGMVLARPIVGDKGSLLINTGAVISPTILKRMKEMHFQGAYIDNPVFRDVIVEDVIPDELRTNAFMALQANNISACVRLAGEIVTALKYKDVLQLDLLDIKSTQNYTIKHCISVAVFSVILGIGMGMTEENLNHLAVAGILHDIGKFQIKKKVLRAKHVYNDKEMEEMEKHPMNAYEFLQDYPDISSVSRNSILFHHENLDGSGYYKIAGEKLGIFPRILRVADTYDAMTASKTYRGSNSPAETMEYLMGNVDTLFDRNVVEVFTRKFPLYPIGFTIKLSNGETAVVVSNVENPMRPMIRKMDGTNINLTTNSAYRNVLIEGIM